MEPAVFSFVSNSRHSFFIRLHCRRRRRRAAAGSSLDSKRTRERENERGGQGRSERGKVEKREERKKLRTERRGVIVLFSTLFEIVVLSALCSSSQVFFLQARGETKDKLQRRPSCDPSHLSINDLVQSRENESTPKADTRGKSVIRTTWSHV